MVNFSGIHFLIIAVPLLGVGLMGTAGYAWYNISALKLPISGVTAMTTGLLPFLSLLLVQYLRVDSRQVQAKRRSGGGGGAGAGVGGIQISEKMLLATFLLLLLDTVIITLGSTHLSPTTETCALDKTWQNLYSSHSPSIKSIQDILQCCGRHSPKDDAYPFPSKSQNHTCITDYPLRAKTPCFPIWKEKDQFTSILLIAVAASAAALKVLAVVMIRVKGSRFMNVLLYTPWWARKEKAVGSAPIVGRVREVGVDGGVHGEDDEEEERYIYDDDAARIRGIGGVNGGGGVFAITAGPAAAGGQENGNGNGATRNGGATTAAQGQLVQVESQPNANPALRYQDLPGGNVEGWGS